MRIWRICQWGIRESGGGESDDGGFGESDGEGSDEGESFSLNIQSN